MLISDIKKRIESELDMQETLSSSSYPTLDQVNKWIADGYRYATFVMPTRSLKSILDVDGGTIKKSKTLSQLLGLASDEVLFGSGSKVIYIANSTIDSKYWRTYSVSERKANDTSTVSLGSNLYQSGKGTFDSTTESWVGDVGTISNVSGELKISVAGSSSGRSAYVDIDSAADMSTDLTVGKAYRVTFSAYGDMDAPFFVIYKKDGTELATLSVGAATKTTYTIDFVATDSTDMKMGIKNTDTTTTNTSIYIDDITVQEVTRSYTATYNMYYERENLQKINGNSLYSSNDYFENTANGELGIKMRDNASSNDVYVYYIIDIDSSDASFDSIDIPEIIANVVILWVRSKVEYQDEDIQLAERTKAEIMQILGIYGRKDADS